jgi:hypothetical protein
VTTLKISRGLSCLNRFMGRITLVLMTAVIVAVTSTSARSAGMPFYEGNLVVSRSLYDDNANNIKVGTILPPNCAQTLGGCSGSATNDGTYPFVFNNDLIDGSFGIASKIFLDQITTAGRLVNSLEVANSSQNGVSSGKDQLVTSFSSKSELALNLSSDDQYLTFMGYVAPINTIDVSNSNTPGVIDPTNPVGTSYFRAIAQVDENGRLRFTKTNAYSGNNGRAAIMNVTRNSSFVYTAGNAGNGANPQPDGVILGAGSQILTALNKQLYAQNPGNPTPVASFNITQLGDKADKIGKDTNFRGLTIFNNVIYLSKGSGGNGINTIYFVDATGTVCTDNNGVGLPADFATLPETPLAYDPALLQSKGLTPNNMCVLKGFSTTPAKSATSFPFGIWFANTHTVYVADEGNGDNTFKNGTYTNAAAQTHAGLQKWIFDATAQQWNLAYTLQAGLDLGIPYTISNYPTGSNPATGLPWSPATDGLRNITGIVNADGTATIYAISSTVSGSGDQGADPNKLVAITDELDATSLPAESFTTMRSAGNLEVLRGISFAPGHHRMPNGS